MGLKDMLRENFSNVRGLNDLKYVDKRILVVGGALLLIALVLYYYYLFGIYLPHKQSARDKYTAQAAKQQAQVQQQQQQQQQQVQALQASVDTGMAPSSKADIPQQNTQGQGNVVDAFKVPGNYMDLSKITPQDSPMFLDSFDVLYDYLNLVFQGKYSDAFVYLNKDFVKSNNITPDNFKIYYDSTYYEQNAFYILDVHKEGPYNVVRMTISDKEHDGTGFNTTYKLVNTNGKYSIILDDLVSFMKAGTRRTQ